MVMVSVYKLVLAALRMQLDQDRDDILSAKQNLYVNCICEGYFSLAKSKRKIQQLFDQHATLSAILFPIL